MKTIKRRTDEFESSQVLIRLPPIVLERIKKDCKAGKAKNKSDWVNQAINKNHNISIGDAIYIELKQPPILKIN